MNFLKAEKYKLINIYNIQIIFSIMINKLFFYIQNIEIKFYFIYLNK